MQITIQELSEVGKVRSHNEDTIGKSTGTPNGDVFVVCDGMGGHVGGKEASRLAVRSILEHFSREKYTNIIQAIDQAFQFANEQIYVHTQVQPELRGMGTTGVILVIKDDLCFFGHVGDSRLYLKTDNELHRLTKDHSYVQELVDKKLITDEEAEQHPKKNQILRALGHQSEVKPDVCELPVKVKKGDAFLICSDGLNGMVNDRVMNDLIDTSRLEVSKDKLFESAMANGGHDNISLILIGIIDSPFLISEFKSFSPVRVRRTQEQSFEHTEQFHTEKSGYADLPSPKKGLNKWVLIVLCIVLLFGGGAAVYLFSKDKKDAASSSVASSDAYTMEDLKGLNASKLKELANDKADVLNIESGAELIIEGKKYILTIENDKLIKVEDKKVIAVAPVDPGVKVVSTVKDSDGDGLIDSKDPCPNDKQNKCKVQSPTIPNGPAVPSDIKFYGNTIYGIAANQGGETPGAVYKRLAGRNDVKALGPNNKVSSLTEICSLNKVRETDTIKAGTWVKFKVN